MRALHALVVVAFSFAAVPVAAQATIAADTVRGIVYDSLLRAPLAGAVVSGDGVQAIADSSGRFVLVASERIKRLMAFHESLELVGLSALDAERPDAPGPWVAILATPSIETVWARMCEGRRPKDGRGGIVFGVVRRAADTLPASAAILELQWEDLHAMRRPGDTSAVYASSVTRSNEEGLFAFCGVQEFGQAGIVAMAGRTRSADVLIPADVRPVRRIDLMIGEPDAHSVVRGMTVDEQGRPVADVTVLVDGMQGTAISDASGRFLIVDVPLGSRMMVARKVGHLPVYRTVDVVTGNPNELVLRIERGVTLEGVKVTARANLSLYRREFEERRQYGFAHLMDSTRLRQYPSLRTALQSYPTLTVQSANNNVDFALLGRITKGLKRCRVHVWVDGVLSDEEHLRVLPLGELAATELFTSDAHAPARFRTFGDTCAVLLVWTRNFLR